MSHLRLLACVALTALLVAGCRKRQMTPPPMDPRQSMEQALADLEAGRFAKSQDEFTYLIFNFPGSRQASDAQFYLAESYFRDRRYSQAQTEFEFYLKSFPNGRFQEEATFKLALSYLRSAPSHAKDQTRSMKAQSIVREFLDDYPDSKFRAAAESAAAEVEERLALKELSAARFYFKSGEYRSALVYYQYVVSEHPLARWSGKDRYQLGVCYAETDDKVKAGAVFEEMAAGDYDSRYKELAQKRLARLR